METQVPTISSPLQPSSSQPSSSSSSEPSSSSSLSEPSPSPSEPSSNFILSKYVYELWICLMLSAVQSYRRETVVSPFPSWFFQRTSDKLSTKDFHQLKDCLENMPTVSELFGNQNELSDSQILNHHLIYPFEDRVQLLKFIFTNLHKKFTLQYFNKIASDKIIKNFGDMPQYLVPDHIFELNYFDNDVFEGMISKHGKRIGFHGSSIENFYSITRNSLLNYSNTKQMTNGAAFGNGIYFCEDLRVARDFSKSARGWKQSQILGEALSCVCLCDIIDHSSDLTLMSTNENEQSQKKSNNDCQNSKYIIAKNSEHIRIRYLLVYTHIRDSKKHEQREKKSQILILFYIAVIVLLLLSQVDFRFLLYKLKHSKE